MALPGIVQNIQDGNLNLASANNSQVMLYMGCCTLGTPDTLAAYGDQSTLTTALDAGRLVEAASYGLQAGGVPVMVMPVTPDTIGSVGSVTHVGSGGTLAITIAPHKAISVACTTGGALGTAKFTFTLGSGSASAPVTSAAGWASTGYRVPGTYCTVIFATGTYTTSDVYTISTAGAIAHSAGSGPGVPTITASPIDDYNVLVTITKSGALGTAQFQYSLDNGETNLAGAGTTSSIVVTAGSGIYVVPSTGLVFTFTGSQTIADTFTFKASGPSCSSFTSALTALETTFLSQDTFALATIVQMPVSASAWSSLAGTLETAALALFDSGVFIRFITEVPSVGSVFTSTGTLTVDSETPTAP